MSIFSCAFARFLSIFFPIFYRKHFSLWRIFCFILLTDFIGLLLILSVSLSFTLIFFHIWIEDYLKYANTEAALLSGPIEYLEWEMNFAEKSKYVLAIQLSVQFFVFVISSIFPFLFISKFLFVHWKKSSKKAIFSNLSVSIAYLLQSLVLLFISFLVIMGFAFDLFLYINVTARIDDFYEILKNASMSQLFSLILDDVNPYDLTESLGNKLIAKLGNETHYVEIPPLINTFGRYLFSNGEKVGIRVLWSLYQLRFLFDHLLILLTLKSYRNVIFGFIIKIFRLIKREKANNVVLFVTRSPHPISSTERSSQLKMSISKRNS